LSVCRSGSHEGKEWSASAVAEYAIDVGSSQLRPLAGFRYLRLKEDGYTETGSVGALTVAGRTTTSRESLLGARFVHPIDRGTGSVEAHATWGHEFGDTAPTLTGRIGTALSPATFTVAGVPLKRDALTFGAGFYKQPTKNVSVYANVAVEMRGSGQTQYGALAGLRYAW
jgi:outer membrane autotransporter protein